MIRVSRQLLQELGREPTPEEIAAKLDMPVRKSKRDFENFTGTGIIGDSDR